MATSESNPNLFIPIFDSLIIEKDWEELLSHTRGILAISGSNILYRHVVDGIVGLVDDGELYGAHRLATLLDLEDKVMWQSAISTRALGLGQFKVALRAAKHCLSVDLSKIRTDSASRNEMRLSQHTAVSNLGVISAGSTELDVDGPSIRTRTLAAASLPLKNPERNIFFANESNKNDIAADGLLTKFVCGKPGAVQRLYVSR